MFDKLKDLGGLMQQAQQMQQKMKELQDQLERLEIVGSSGAGMVKVTVNGKNDTRRVEIDASLFKAEHPDWLIVAATFATRPEPPAQVRARLLEVQKHRRDTQPIEQRSLGSTFKNPPGDSAGRLIDASGLKGLRIGGAQISPKHANFIVNVDGATADDVLALMAEMRGRVLQRFGIELEPEVRIIGRTPPA